VLTGARAGLFVAGTTRGLRKSKNPRQGTFQEQVTNDRVPVLEDGKHHWIGQRYSKTELPGSHVEFLYKNYSPYFEEKGTLAKTT
jgi:hypothetical protein